MAVLILLDVFQPNKDLSGKAIDGCKQAVEYTSGIFNIQH